MSLARAKSRRKTEIRKSLFIVLFLGYLGIISVSFAVKKINTDISDDTYSEILSNEFRGINSEKYSRSKRQVYHSTGETEENGM